MNKNEIYIIIGQDEFFGEIDIYGENNKNNYFTSIEKAYEKKQELEKAIEDKIPWRKWDWNNTMVVKIEKLLEEDENE